jgi:hypothetical protein
VTRLRVIVCGGAVVVGLAACTEREAAAPGPIRFTTLGPDQTGVDVPMTSGTEPATQILEVNGGGLGLVDNDRDGDLDLFVANGATLEDPENGPGCRLYENVGGLRFRDVSAEAGIDLRRWAMGVAVADYDGDGWDDLYVTCYGPNVLLRNVEGRYADVTAAAGLGDPSWSTSSAFGDLDGDGDADLYVVNYLEFDVRNPPARSRFKGVSVMAGPHGLPAQHDVLYENLGDGTFRDITEAAGCLVGHPTYGLGVVILDLNGDGRQDIFVGNDSMQNFYFRNLGGLRFEEAGALSGLAANADGGEQATMGIAVADVDGNGRPDLFTTNFSSDTNTLQLNLDGTYFDDRTMQYGLGMVSRPFLGWSCGFYDFDLDGDEDLFMVNGHVYPQATMATMDAEYRQVPLLFQRAGPRFERLSDPQSGSLLSEPRRDRAAAFGDLDGDGDVDIVVGELNGPIRILRNDAAGRRWLVVVLADDSGVCGDHRGLGARVEVTSGDVVQRRWLYSGGMQSSSPPQAHFGVPGTASSVSVEVVWPDGQVQRLADVALDQRLIVERP